MFDQGCCYGWIEYPDWVETSEDLYNCSFESECTLVFDKGRLEGEPTEKELKEFEKWCHMLLKRLLKLLLLCLILLQLLVTFLNVV